MKLSVEYIEVDVCVWCVNHTNTYHVYFYSLIWLLRYCSLLWLTLSQ